MIEKAEPSLIGRRFCVEEKKGTILYQGPVGATKGEWLGVEWDDPSRGKHDGAHEGVRYFIPRNYSPTSSSFLRINKVNLGINLLEGVRLRYGKVEGETAGVGQECMDDLQKEIGARFVQVKKLHVFLSCSHFLLLKNIYYWWKRGGGGQYENVLVLVG